MPNRSRSDEEAARRPFEARIAAAFRKAVEALQAQVFGEEEPRDVIAGGDAIDVDGVLDRHLMEPVTALLADVMQRGMRLADATVTKAPSGFDWTIADQLAHEWAQMQAGVLVTGVSQRTRRAIRDVIALGLRENHTIPEISRNLRRVIGLTPRDAKAVARLRRQLLKSGVKPSEAERRVGRRADALVRRRAITIARTETAMAIEQGKLAEWRIAVQQGDLPGSVRRKWIAKDACPVCRELAAQAAIPLGQPFRVRSGKSWMHPPAHPRCRCSVVLVMVGRGFKADVPREPKVARWTPIPFKSLSWGVRKADA